MPVTVSSEQNKNKMSGKFSLLTVTPQKMCGSATEQLQEKYHVWI